MAGKRRGDRRDRFSSPSMKPTIATLTPKLVVRKSGNSANTISDDTSMKKLTDPSVQIVRGLRGRIGDEDEGTGKYTVPYSTRAGRTRFSRLS